MTQHKGSLGGGVFSIREVEYLESLPAVDRVRSGRIVYNDAFKRDCIRRYRNGESPAEIFRSAGLDSALIGYKRIERSIARWKATLGDDGEPPTVPSPFIVSTDTRWNPSQRRRLNSVSSTPNPRYWYVDDTADTVKQYDLMRKVSTNHVQATVCLNNAYPECSPEGTCMMYFTTMFMSDDWGNVTEEDYFKAKDRVADDMIRVFERETGCKIRDAIEEICVASPTTYARYCGHPEGVIYGY